MDIEFCWDLVLEVHTILSVIISEYEDKMMIVIVMDYFPPAIKFYQRSERTKPMSNFDAFYAHT